MNHKRDYLGAYGYIHDLHSPGLDAERAAAWAGMWSGYDLGAPIGESETVL